MNRPIATRKFSEADQMRFAGLSGDFNPMHVDAVTARRIGAGAPVVHGIHSLLWCLDCVAATIEHRAPVATIRANFDSFVTTSDEVEVIVMQSDTKRLRVEMQVRGLTAVTLLLGFGDAVLARFGKPDGLMEPAEPLNLRPEQMSSLAGRLAFATSAADIAASFPHATDLLGERRVAALGAFTRLIGMVCPGLHSVFNRLSLDSSEDDGADDIGFRVTSADLERRRLLLSVGGGGWVGTLTSLIRHQPTAQPSIDEVAGFVTKGEFENRIALVIGGSRGIGEVAAKMVAAGGGKVIITFSKGESDANRVAKEILEFGGICQVARLDIRLPIVEQLSRLGRAPQQMLYFATPMIGGRRTQLFEPDRLTEFMSFYVTGFYDCCTALMSSAGAAVTALYPSSIFVQDRPAGVVEYAMAKSAGEQLCADMSKQMPSFRAVVARLPRLATDQNPGLLATSEQSEVCKLLLPLIREVCSGRANA